MVDEKKEVYVLQIGDQIVGVYSSEEKINEGFIEYMKSGYEFAKRMNEMPSWGYEKLDFMDYIYRNRDDTKFWKFNLDEMNTSMHKIW